MSASIQKLLKNNTRQNPLKLLTTTLIKATTTTTTTTQQQLNLTNPPLLTNHNIFSPNPNVKDSNFTHVYPSFPFGYCLNSVSSNGFCVNSVSQNGVGFFDEIDNVGDDNNDGDGVVRADSVKKKRKRKMNKHKYKKLKKSLRRKSRT